MKTIKFLTVIVVFLTLASCSSVKVIADYDQSTDFTKYKTFAFYKKGIDKAEISDLDKRRILKAVEAQLLAKGFTKSENPDILVNIFTKAQKKVNVYNNDFMGYGYGFGGYYGWYPWYYGPNFGPQISTYTEGTLFVDFIDAAKKELIWQGIGSGGLNTSGNVTKKEERVKEFVNQIMAQYPPAPVVEKK
ncbi:DUF4136 domain-containing protein [Lutibacter sp. HS1-25]|uniref:DUF4136 domain-containing protein n=1 Tax=Lutibacter sp. HS1-25 TaxID=2485000 RepID=UPI0010129473|nr:DUF4136 domain-containing protein [Lutibacter sp. HS1-25]RXP63287.1 DUF4136 domain-containing protein [Lutibacter sp. HS1-25]